MKYRATHSATMPTTITRGVSRLEIAAEVDIRASFILTNASY